jgi:hypothetical protein
VIRLRQQTFNPPSSSLSHFMRGSRTPIKLPTRPFCRRPRWKCQHSSDPVLLTCSRQPEPRVRRRVFRSALKLAKPRLTSFIPTYDDCTGERSGITTDVLDSPLLLNRRKLGKPSQHCHGGHSFASAKKKILRPSWTLASAASNHGVGIGLRNITDQPQPSPKAGPCDG